MRAHFPEQRLVIEPNKKLTDKFCYVAVVFRCKLRIVDSFGTEAQFNFNLFKENIPGGSMGAFGRHNLNLRQFQTMFRKYAPDCIK